MLESARIGGIDLYYQDAGEGDAVVFLHGFGGNHLIWWQQVAAFSGDYRCVAPDQRMFGRSVDTEGSGAAAFVDDLEALLDHLGVDRAAVVAQSMGGWTAASFATQHPDRVAALVLADTPGGLIPPEEWRVGRDDEEEGVSRAYSDDLAPEMAFLYDAISALNVHRPAEFDEIHPDLRALPADPDAITDAGVPVLMIVGEDDPLTPAPALRRVHERLDGSEFVVVPGSGHSVYFERPGEFNRLVGEFVASEARF